MSKHDDLWGIVGGLIVVGFYYLWPPIAIFALGYWVIRMFIDIARGGL